ncbi:unnamed protein product [Ectocarpus sp. 8 AP-2014]
MENKPHLADSAAQLMVVTPSHLVSTLLTNFSCTTVRPHALLPFAEPDGPLRMLRSHGRTRVQLSRETKKQQRRTFRQLFATIGENEPPEEVVSLQNGSLTVADWAHIKQLNALRSCLQSGFQTQMQSNELLREILGVSKWGGTGGEKPFYSKNSEVRKQQTTSRTRSRHSKQEAQDHIFLGEGAEER